MITIKPTQDILEYNGRPMNPQPINMVLTAVAVKLRTGNPVIVQLEPGDATHYSLLLVPCWAEDVRGYLGRFGIRTATAACYIHATLLSDRGGQSFFVPAGLEEDIDIKNHWAKQLLAWWFRQLWKDISK